MASSAEMSNHLEQSGLGVHPAILHRPAHNAAAKDVLHLLATHRQASAASAATPDRNETAVSMLAMRHPGSHVIDLPSRHRKETTSKIETGSESQRAIPQLGKDEDLLVGLSEDNSAADAHHHPSLIERNTTDIHGPGVPPEIPRQMEVKMEAIRTLTKGQIKTVKGLCETAWIHCSVMRSHVVSKPKSVLRKKKKAQKWKEVPSAKGFWNRRECRSSRGLWQQETALPIFLRYPLLCSLDEGGNFGPGSNFKIMFKKGGFGLVLFAEIDREMLISPTDNVPASERESGILRVVIMPRSDYESQLYDDSDRNAPTENLLKELENYAAIWEEISSGAISAEKMPQIPKYYLPKEELTALIIGRLRGIEVKDLLYVDTKDLLYGHIRRDIPWHQVVPVRLNGERKDLTLGAFIVALLAASTEMRAIDTKTLTMLIDLSSMRKIPSGKTYGLKDMSGVKTIAGEIVEQLLKKQPKNKSLQELDSLLGLRSFSLDFFQRVIDLALGSANQPVG
ncbi:unnamed protein product [Vitrella brassicaformis CCMP3155]|uniref:Uncharacterized protein n=2 Tax=Vitrella brassicaformis TaxID=1169539 RepID=A0A0G4H5B3_VITBC|nr:unnamed protein product [Vitrella brassicaformis CCMP3155]|eukprot:CEM38817.1 unnamed protein product [Vitrella brassicaformis CCMP3155]